MNEYRVIASRVTNYVAYIEAEDEQEAELLALNGNTDWQFLDDDDYEIYEIEGGRLMKLDVTLDELSIINCALDDYYDFMIAYYRTSEYYECKEIKSIRDRVDLLHLKKKRRVAKRKASQPIPEW